jgi:cysteine synthase
VLTHLGAVYQAIKTAREMEQGNIVVILADGGWKYLSMDFSQTNTNGK